MGRQPASTELHQLLGRDRALPDRFDANQVIGRQSSPGQLGLVAGALQTELDRRDYGRGLIFVERITVHLLSLPLVEPFQAAHGTVQERELTVVRVDTDVGPGWGECSALPDPTYTNEFAAGAYRQLVTELAPAVVDRRLDPADVWSTCPQPARRPMAVAALEMAVLDASLRAEDRSLAAHLATGRADVGDLAPSVVAGAAIGLGSIDEVTASARRLSAGGFSRLKLKVQPGHDIDVVRAIREAVPEVELQVDGNGSFGPNHLDLLAAMAETGVTAIEQPFHPADIQSAQTLVAHCSAVVVADEAAPDLAAVLRLHEAGALGGVSIKPPRVGGMAPALALHDACRERGLAASAGGMLECGLGRRALAAMAALPGFTLAGDVSPAARWLTIDPWPDLELRVDPEGGRIMVPDGPGVAPEPDLDLLSDVTTRRDTIS